jgi:hypothetical protein
VTTSLQSIADLDEAAYDRAARELHDEIGAHAPTDATVAWFLQTAAASPCEVCGIIKRRLKALAAALDESTTLADRGRL